MMKELGITMDGVIVYSHPETHSHRPDLNEEVISKITIGNRPFVVETVTLNRVIGVDHLVETRENDIIVDFERGNRPNRSRMVLNRTPEPTDKVTIVVCRCGEEDGELQGKYALVTLYEGQAGNPEPYGKNDTPENWEFWWDHALVPTKQEMDAVMNTVSSTGLFIVRYWESNYEDSFYGTDKEEVFNSLTKAKLYAEENLLKDIYIHDITLWTATFKEGRLEREKHIMYYEKN